MKKDKGILRKRERNERGAADSDRVVHEKARIYVQDNGPMSVSKSMQM